MSITEQEFKDYKVGISTLTNPQEIINRRREFLKKSGAPSVPEGTGKKRYMVVCSNGEDWKSIHEVLIKDGTLEDNIPSDSCECCDESELIDRIGYYLLTDAEVEDIKKHPKVLDVNIDESYYRATYGGDCFEKELLLNYGVTDRYGSPVNHNRELTFTNQDTWYINIGLINGTTGTGYAAASFTTAHEVTQTYSANFPTSIPDGTIITFLFERTSKDDRKFRFRYDNSSTSITSAPSSGEVRFNNSNLSSATGVAWSNTDLDGNNFRTTGYNYYGTAYGGYSNGTTVCIGTFNSPSSTLSKSGHTLLRCTQKNDPWSGSSKSTTITSNTPKRSTGKDVDIIVFDSGTWFGHVEFVKTGVGEPDDYIGGNALDPNGKCGVLSLYLDAPYYLDPEFFNADQTNRTEIRWDGTRVPTQTAALNWWQGIGSVRSARFLSGGDDFFGYISVPSMAFTSYGYTRPFIQGSHSAYPSQQFNSHGTAVSSLIFGKTLGMAYNANKWVHGHLEDDLIVPSNEDAFKMLKIFHKYKPNNSNHGNKNPTITNHSWGSGYNLTSTNATHYFWRTPGNGTAGSGEIGSIVYDADNKITSPKYLKNNYYNPHIEPWFKSTHSRQVAAKSAIDEGVIVVAAAGNNNQKCVKSTHPDYNNYFGNANNVTATTALDSQASDASAFINRLSFPCSAGEFEDTDSSSPTYGEIVNPSFAAAATSDIGKSNTQESKIYYSYSGNAVDFYAPGHNTLTATLRDAPNSNADKSNVARPNSWAITKTYYRNDSTYTITVNGTNLTSTLNFNQGYSGSSFASPTACGLLATKLEHRRSWGWKELKNWVSNNVSAQSSSQFYVGNEGTTANDSDFDDQYSLHGGSPKVLYDAPLDGNTSAGTLNVTGTLNITT